ncbi:uracil-DNA glycosylase (plasmid) [Halorussus salilacus]|uniref:uracil-DNA glycosylase family protein n=1 Tax=Halorussus salilacus TaxID=2953750 RepID=UPI00209CD22E|nr:uracil-DNA glycosylase family protein [Halorussus salilacus]USZ69983.1 uracil-DNA glycosylase [Halorussus salilacus]
MKNVTDRTSNPFDMRPPCEHDCGAAPRRAVFGYGDANADFHLVGDHPGVHGGVETGVPFTGSVAGERLRPVLNEVGLVGDGDASGVAVADREFPPTPNLFASYLHMCCLPGDREPTAREYDDLEPFFDAELRAIAAHVLVPVGERATRHVLGTYAARESLVEARGMDALHADHVPGSGFLVVPVKQPSEWTGDDGERLTASLADLLESDYRQTADLSRFVATEDTYEVR